MNNYSVRTNQRKWLRVILIVAIVVGLLGTGAAVAVRNVYNDNLRAVSSSENSITIDIEMGSSPQDIAELLEGEGLIRSAWAFEWYVRNEGLRDKLQAGTYALRPSMSIPQIVEILTQGQIATDLVTILPGKRLDEIRDALVNYGFEPSVVDDALDPKHYADHPALVDKPNRASLEGYLYPESFHKTATTDPKQIIKASLDEMHKRLTPDIRAGIVRQGLTVHEGITLASVIEMEVSDENPEDKPRVAQVFLRRLNENMALESDATASYGAVLDNQPPSQGYTSPYNTYQNPGLPPSPVSNVSQSSLEALINPADTDYLFFVSGDDCLVQGGTCTNYFSRTLEEHHENVRRYCQARCQ
jgi:UPF0755 protein